MSKGAKVIHEPKCNMYDTICGEIIEIGEDFATVQYEQNGSLVIQNFKFTEIRQYEN